MNGPRVVTKDELADASRTSGMTRWTAFDVPGVWAGTAHTDAGAVSGWHHHGDNTTIVYCASGAVRMESGPDGRDVVEAGPGDFMLVPANTIHRESNPSDAESVVILTRVGSGPVVTNVDGPDRA